MFIKIKLIKYVAPLYWYSWSHVELYSCTHKRCFNQ